MKLCFLPKSVSLTFIQPVMVPARFPWLSADLTIIILRREIEVLVGDRKVLRCVLSYRKSMFFMINNIL